MPIFDEDAEGTEGVSGMRGGARLIGAIPEEYLRSFEDASTQKRVAEYLHVLLLLLESESIVSLWNLICPVCKKPITNRRPVHKIEGSTVVMMFKCKKCRERLHLKMDLSRMRNN